MISLKSFVITLLWKQNKWHKYSVLRHTLAVAWWCIKLKKYSMVWAALLHDIGKPLVAFQDEEDIAEGGKSYSFTGHEEKSYQIIRNVPDWLISQRTKQLVRYHYLITGMAVDLYKFNKTKQYDYLASYGRRLDIWTRLPETLQYDLMLFKFCDDKGKGYHNIRKAVPMIIEDEYNKVIRERGW